MEVPAIKGSAGRKVMNILDKCYFLDEVKNKSANEHHYKKHL
ncbi:Hypothetical protein EAG7_00756 [Klebsiella aerogenes]|nr:Hypothetical protein EAG7_00756 [Klebsiella aerogenes]PVF76288.1 hypothetical protein CSC18_2139 [Klebsiella aerogenes]CCG29312.1 hypothetical protein [Klebsiella aerogenes EA1509E]